MKNYSAELDAEMMLITLTSDLIQADSIELATEKAKAIIRVRYVKRGLVEEGELSNLVVKELA